MDLFKYAKHSKNKKLKTMATHELEELGGSAMAEKFEKHVKSLKAGSKSKILEKFKGRVGSGKSHYSGKHYKHD